LTDKIRKLQFTPSGDPNLVISGGHLDNLTINGYLRGAKKRFLPKLLLDSIDTLYIGDFDLQEDCPPPKKVKHLLACGETEPEAFATYLSSVCSNLQTLGLYLGHKPLQEKNIFTNLVCLRDLDTGELSMENFPKLLLLVQCKTYRGFFDRSCNLICKIVEDNGRSFCIRRNRFDAETIYYTVMILDNFTISQMPSGFTKIKDSSLAVYDVEEKNLPRLVSWIELNQPYDVSISDTMDKEKKSKLEGMIN
jgi:hypothetical protein